MNNLQSFQNLKKLKRQQQEKAKVQTIELRQTFKDLCYKTASPHTRKHALQQLPLFILKNKTVDNLRLWISVLQEKGDLNADQIALIGLLGKQYGKRLLDPLDKMPSVIKTSYRLLQIVNKNLKQEDEELAKSAKKTWSQFYLSVLYNQAEDQKKMILYDLLQLNITGGADRAAQMNSLVILQGLFQTLAESEDEMMLRCCGKSMIATFIRIYMQSASLFGCLLSIIGFLGMQSLKTIRQLFINKVILYLNNCKPAAQGIYLLLKALELLKLVAVQSLQFAQDLSQSEIAKVKGVLLSLTSNRVYKIQHAAREALKDWIQLQNMIFKINNQKMRIRQSPGKQSSCQKAKPRKQKQRQPLIPQSDKQSNFFSKNKQFVKKKTGSGGGRIDLQLQARESVMAGHRKIQDSLNPKQTQQLQEETAMFQEGQEESLLKEWKQTYSFALADDFQKAYEKGLQMDDDLYLLRLMAITGNQFNKLTRNTSKRLVNKFADVVGTNFMDRLLFWMVQDLADNKSIGFLQNQTVEGLHNELIKIECLQSQQSAEACRLRKRLDC